MKERRAIVGLCMLCALLAGAIAAQSASAATTGTTTFTCVDSGVVSVGKLFGEHCRTTNAEGGVQSWEHKEIKQDETTHATSTNAKTKNKTTEAAIWELRSVVGGVPVTTTATEVHGTGWVTNAKDPTTGEHYGHLATTLTLSNVKVTEPANCAVEGITAPGGAGMITTVPLVATTKEKGMNLEFKPETGEFLSEYKIVSSGGACAAALNPVKLWGSVKAQAVGGSSATYELVESTVTTEKTLRLGSKAGTLAGLGGIFTLLAGEGKEAEGKTTRPISTTTVTTP